MPNLSESAVHHLENLVRKYLVDRPNCTITGTAGTGGSAAVFKGTEKGRQIAIKAYDVALFHEPNEAAEEHRLELQKNLIGKHCEYLVDIYNIEKGHGTYFVEMEYCNWPPLQEVLGQVPEEQIANLIYQLVQAARFLEGLGFVHRDIKPENILIHPSFSALKLVDFGVLRDITLVDDLEGATDHGKRRPFIATAQYSSPEYLFRLIEPSPDLWKGLTFYQIGAVLHDLLTKTPIFQEEADSGNRFKLAWAVLHKTPNFDLYRTETNKQLIALAAACLTKDLAFRLNLVRWEDFEPGPRDSAAELTRRLEKLQASRTHHGTVAAARRQLELKRNTQRENLHQHIQRELLNLYGDSLKIETIRQSDQSSFQLKLVLPSDMPSLIVDVRLLWGTGVDADKAKVSLSVRSDGGTTPEPTNVGETNTLGTNDATLCDSIINKASDLITRILDSLDIVF